MIFVHFTDTHLQAPESKAYLNLDTTQKFREAVATVRALGVQPDFFIISGDLCHEGVVADYRHAKSLIEAELQPFGVPVLVALGNHDHRQPFREGFLNEPEADAPYYYAQMIGDVRVIVLDSKVGQHNVEGMIDAEQIEWLKALLQQPAPGGSIIVLHHPPTPNTLPMLKDHGLRNAEALADVLEGHSVHGIFAGHIHFNSIGSFHGITTAAGTGVAFELAPAGEGMHFYDSWGFNLVQIADGITTVQPIAALSQRKELYSLTREQLQQMMAQQHA